MAARAKGAKKKAVRLRKYVYLVLDQDGDLSETPAGRLVAVKTPPQGIQTARYVLESSIRPGGKP